MTMVLSTFPERKVGRTEGYIQNNYANGMTPSCKSILYNFEGST